MHTPGVQLQLNLNFSGSAKNRGGRLLGRLLARMRAGLCTH